MAESFFSPSRLVLPFVVINMLFYKIFFTHKFKLDMVKDFEKKQLIYRIIMRVDLASRLPFTLERLPHGQIFYMVKGGCGREIDHSCCSIQGDSTANVMNTKKYELCQYSKET